MNYIERERQRGEALQQEGLDWLHELHEESRRQTLLLEEVRQHTHFFYVVMIIWLVLTGLGLLIWIAESASAW